MTHTREQRKELDSTTYQVAEYGTWGTSNCDE
jgi:hypothetical protein